jgi:hypothetical protein
MRVVKAPLLWIRENLEGLANHLERFVGARRTVLGVVDHMLVIWDLCHVSMLALHTLSGCNDNANFRYAFLITTSSQPLSTESIS